MIADFMFNARDVGLNTNTKGLQYIKELENTIKNDTQGVNAFIGAYSKLIQLCPNDKNTLNKIFEYAKEMEQSKKTPEDLKKENEVLEQIKKKEDERYNTNLKYECITHPTIFNQRIANIDNEIASLNNTYFNNIENNS